MEEWADKAAEVTGRTIEQAITSPDKMEVSVAGVIVAHNIKSLKRGTGKMVFFDLEDTTARVQCKLFSKKFDQWTALGEDLHIPVVVKGRIHVEGQGESTNTSR